MIYHLLRHLHDPVTNRPLFGFYAYENGIFRSVAATLTSLLIALFSGPKVIRWLMRKKIGDRPEFHHATLNELTKEKANTPTMGGLIIVFATLAATFLWTDLWNPFVQKGIYQVDDGSGKIWVVSQKRRPSRGQQVTVKGIIRTGFSINNQTFGVVITEGDGEE